MGCSADNAVKNAAKIRNFRSGEEAALVRVFLCATADLQAQNPLPQGMEVLAPNEPGSEPLADQIRARRPFVAEMDGDIAGFATLVEPGRIEDFYVLPDFTGKGVGDALMTHVETIARRQELPELYANACLGSEAFFHQNGFYTARRGNTFFNGFRIPHMHMRKRLS